MHRVQLDLSAEPIKILKLLKSSALLLLFNVFMNAKRFAAILHPAWGTFLV